MRKTSWILPVGSLIAVFNLPSENVPAPPSPNWTFDSVLSAPPCQNASTSFLRCSILSPRSNTIGRSPASASFNAANIPAGPKPIMTGRSSSFKICLDTAGNVYPFWVTGVMSRFFNFLIHAASSTGFLPLSRMSETCTLYMYKISGLCLESMDCFAISMRQVSFDERRSAL